MEPRSPTIFANIRTYGRNVLLIANDICEDHVRLATTQEQLKFNLRCKKSEVLPKSIRTKPPIRSPEGYRIARSANNQYLRAFITDNHFRIGVYLRRIVINTNKLQELIPTEIFERLKAEAVRKHRHVRAIKKQQLIRKYEKLLSEHPCRTYNPRWVTNLSDKQLTKDEECVLAKGLAFATTHVEKDKLHFVAAVEPVINNLTNITIDEKNNLRQRISTAIQSVPANNNLTVNERKAINNLKNDTSIVILTADKGKSTVVMNKVEYNEKIKRHLEDSSTYQPVANNPTRTLQNKVNNELRYLKNLCSLTDGQYKYLRATTASIPLFYALIKTHKEHNPIRPIVSFIDSPTYKLAQHLSRILTPISDMGATKLKNTMDAKITLQEQIIPHDYSLVSLDVKSLFTCIPQDFALNSCELALNNYTDLTEHTALDAAEVLMLTKLCLESCTFQWNNNFYKQIRGCPMGSPISVVIAELTMQNFESLALSNPPCHPLFWKRYVDDIITALPTVMITDFLCHINSINQHIKFTFEKETNNSIPFLDLLIIRDDVGRLKFSIYKKETHTDRYIDSSSYHPVSHKIGTALSLIDRANNYCSNEYVKEELDNVNNSLKINGYSNTFINRCLQKRLHPSTHIEQNENLNNNKVKKKKYVSAPYIRGTSERTAKLLRPYGIELAHRTQHSLKSQLSHVKDTRQQSEKTGIVYKINCKNCAAHYIGESGRELGTRVKEHRNAIRRKDPLSAIYRHISTTQHDMDWDDVKILANHHNANDRQVLESIYTLNNPNALNRTIMLPVTYIPIVSTILNNNN
jgi:hypothetical protein